MLPHQGRSGTELAQAIERRIAQRTWGRIHRLQVDVRDDCVVVQGYVQTYHGKQLALEGVRDEVGDSMQIRLDVQVGPRSPALQQQVSQAIQAGVALL